MKSFKAMNTDTDKLFARFNVEEEPAAVAAEDQGKAPAPAAAPTPRPTPKPKQPGRADHRRKAAEEIKTRRVSVVLTPTEYQDAADLAYFERLSFNSLVCELIDRYIKANRGKLDALRKQDGGK